MQWEDVLEISIKTNKVERIKICNLWGLICFQVNIFFHKNSVYKNYKAQISEILRILLDVALAKWQRATIKF